MTSTFLISIDHDSDTDLLSIATEIQDAVEHEGMIVLSCRPWATPSTLGASLPTPPDVSGQQ